MADQILHTAYTLIKTEKLEDLNATGYLLQHKRSGAKIVLIDNDDVNKVFYIGFRTPPKDSTGVAHIIEHTVLCGSNKYPVKDPFVELVKGSLNTFLNAMTYPDKTVYPVASCNDVDFKNLMDIYLDAVLNPNIYDHEEIFRQEGWHYELTDREGELSINGVVYNEMKGAFSSPESVLERASLNSLYPDTTYAIESGGDPKNIPDLTYEDYLDFHRKYYHPCNAYLYLYGDMDMTERLDYLDREYLSHYDAIEVDSAITMQAPFTEPKRFEMTYPISNDESEENQTYLAYNVSCSTSLDDVLYQAMDILEYALTGTNGAPLKKALTDAGIGEDNYGSFESGIYQPFFSIVSHGANPSDADRFLQIIQDVLREQVEKGLDKKALYAAINSAQFKYREADFGSYPKGLIYGLQIFDSWLYDSEQPFLHLHGSVVLDRIRDMVEEGYFEHLIQTYLLDNPHSSFLVVRPERGKLAAEEQALKDKLAAYKAGLSDQELDAIIAFTAHLKEYQSTPDTEEDLLKIPMLSRADLDPKARPFNYTVKQIDGVDCIHTNVFTNGIHYIGLSFLADSLSAEELCMMSCLMKSIGALDTAQYGYNDLANEINLHTGGISAAPHIFRRRDGSYRLTADISMKYLASDRAAAFALLEQVLFCASFTDSRHFRELMAMDKVRIESQMTQAGHTVAASRACSYMTEASAVGEYLNGLEFYRFEKDFLADFDSRYVDFVEKAQAIAKKLFRRENLVVDITGDDRAYKEASASITELMTHLYTDPIERKILHIEPVKRNEGLKNASQIQYVARTGNFAAAGYDFVGPLQILKVILGYDYFWTNIRVKGGAYGCMCNFKRDGELTFVSYRDPNLAATNDVFEGTASYLAEFDADEREMTKYIIGTISNIDTPLTASQQGERNVSAYFCGLSLEKTQENRDRILHAQPEDIRALAPLVAACMSQGYICVVGNENAIEENAALFMEVTSLI